MGEATRGNGASVGAAVIPNLLNRIWASDELLAVVLAAVLSVIGWTLIRLFTPRGKITWAVSHQHAFDLQNLQPPIVVYTSEIWIQNVGRATVDEVEVILNFPPEHFDIWPQRQCTQQRTPNGNLALIFDHLNPREYFTISLFQRSALPPATTNVRWKGGIGSQKPMGPQQIWPRWARILFLFLLLMGVFAVFYLIVRLTLWIIT